MSERKSLQETYAPRSICYGCGPANPQGLHIRSFPEGDVLVAEWTPQPHHQAFPGALNGGIIGTLLDCHCNWAAAYHHQNVAPDARGCPPAIAGVGGGIAGQ
jgi:acyl-coenzyme A thioesterase PaaI-like protein